MAFPLPTYIPQQQAGQPPDLSQPGQQTFSTPSAHFHASQSVGQTTLQSQDSPASQFDLMSHPVVQALIRQRDSAFRKIREYEETILHLATASRPGQSLHSESLRTQHGIICPDCKEEVPHACNPLVIALSSVQPPRSQQPSYTIANPTGSQTGLTGDLIGESSVQQLLPSSLNISSVLGSHSANPDPCAPTPSTAQANPLAVLPAGPGPSITMHSQYNFSNENSLLGKRDLHHTDLECELETKRTRPNFPEEKVNKIQQSEFHPSQSSDPRHSSFIEPRPSAPKAIMPSSDPEVLSTTPNVISEQLSGAGWDIAHNGEVKRTYNVEIKRAIDVSLVRLLNTGTGFAVRCVNFSKDGKFLAVGFYDNGKTNIYDVQTGEKTCTLRDLTNENKETIYHVCFSPNGLYLATVSWDDLIRIWEISEKHVRNVFRSRSQPECYISCIDFSPDGRLIAAGTAFTRSMGSLEIWNWQDGSQRIFEDLKMDVSDIRFSPDRKYIAVGTESGGVLIWNVRTGRLVEKLGNCDRTVHTIAFTPDGTGLFSGSWDETVEFSDLTFLGLGSLPKLEDVRLETANSTGEELLNFRGLDTDFGCVGVSSNGRWVVSCSFDGSIRISDVHSAELHCELSMHRNLEDCHFSLTGDFLAVSPADESRVLIWRLREV